MNKRKLIMDSVDVRRYKSGAAPFVVACLLIILIVDMAYAVTFWGSVFDPPGPFLAINFAYICTFLPIILYCMRKIIRIVKRIPLYIFGLCTLSEVGCANGHYYFRVDVKTAEGTFHTCTNAIYSDTSIHAGFNDWKNKQVIVAYDREIDIAIVLCQATRELYQQLVLHKE